MEGTTSQLNSYKIIVEKHPNIYEIIVSLPVTINNLKSFKIPYIHIKSSEIIQNYIKYFEVRRLV